MAGAIYEFFGYRAEDPSEAARLSALAYSCPFLGEICEKRLSRSEVSGACAIKPVTSQPVICCPIRLYADNYRVLQIIADEAFGLGQTLVPGGQGRVAAIHENKPIVAVFGKHWGGELRLPQKSGHGNYFVDWILAHLTASGSLDGFVAVEVQTMDTTGNYQAGREALLNDERSLIKTTVGINWENVSKRIIPQLVYKGRLLQREKLCHKGIYFVCPQPVFSRILERLGGRDHLPDCPQQPGAIKFLAFDYMADATVDGTPTPLSVLDDLVTTVSDLQTAFGTVTLPSQNVYQAAIEAALGSVEPATA